MGICRCCGKGAGTEADGRWWREGGGSREIGCWLEVTYSGIGKVGRVMVVVLGGGCVEAGIGGNGP